MVAARADLTALQRSLALDGVVVKGPVPADFCPAGALRVVSWNIAGGRAPERIAAALRALRPDIVCLQEVDWGNERTRGVDVLQHLAEATGMQGLYGVEFLELVSPARGRRLAGGGATGNALLTRLAPVSTFRVALPPCLDWEASDSDASRLPVRARRSLRQERRIGQRFGLASDLQIGDRRLRVCSLHLEDKRGGIAGRWAQFLAAARAMDTASAAPDTRIIAGDFNTFDSRLARLLTRDDATTALGKPADMTEAAWWHAALLPRTGYADPFSDAAWTFAAGPFFRAKLDWIASVGCQCINCGVGPFASSDHRPIWADLQLQNP
jgi:endonuclease/exonuclease/phosphatase family metal-dependent hydrolase